MTLSIDSEISFISIFEEKWTNAFTNPKTTPNILVDVSIFRKFFGDFLLSKFDVFYFFVNPSNVK